MQVKVSGMVLGARLTWLTSESEDLGCSDFSASWFCDLELRAEPLWAIGWGMLLSKLSPPPPPLRQQQQILQLRNLQRFAVGFKGQTHMSALPSAFSRQVLGLALLSPDPSLGPFKWAGKHPRSFRKTSIRWDPVEFCPLGATCLKCPGKSTEKAHLLAQGLGRVYFSVSLFIVF